MPDRTIPWGVGRYVSSYLSKTQYNRFKEIAYANNVSMSAYLRAVITDIIEEEDAIALKHIIPNPVQEHNGPATE